VVDSQWSGGRILELVRHLLGALFGLVAAEEAGSHQPSETTMMITKRKQSITHVICVMLFYFNINHHIDIKPQRDKRSP
jgi:hypothetical protein